MSRIADETEGEYFHVPVSNISPRRRVAGTVVYPVVENKVANIYRMINEREMGYVRIWSDEGVVNVSGKHIYFTIYEGMRNLLLTVNQPAASDLDVTVFNPNGDPIGHIVYDSSYMIYSIPIFPGTWSLRLGASEDEPYLVRYRIHKKGLPPVRLMVLQYRINNTYEK